MAIERTFHWARLKGPQRNWQPIFEQIGQTTLPALEERDAHLWGAFHGLFGIGSNEIIMVTSWGLDHDPVAELTLPDNVERVEEIVLVPTVRPARDQQLTRPGLYVFRFFDVRNADVEEIAELSHTAWTTFEDTSEYAAEPQGLFCQKDRSSERGVMLLLTWYDGLNSWQTSRRPHPDATANFRRRHELTFGTIAYATRLIES